MFLCTVAIFLSLHSKYSVFQMFGYLVLKCESPCTYPTLGLLCFLNMCRSMFFYQIWKVLSHCFSKIFPFSFLSHQMYIGVLHVIQQVSEVLWLFTIIFFLWPTDMIISIDLPLSLLFFSISNFLLGSSSKFLFQLLYFSTPKFTLGVFFIIPIFLWNTLFVISLLSHFP